MRYKKFGNTGIELSVLGFGAMRLPMLDTADGKKIVDEDAAVAILRRAFELGVNYVDTAPYYCEKLSEVAVGKALKGWRDKVYLSTKNPIEDDSGAHWRERLENSLKKLDTDYIDFYHMWGISLETFKTKIDVKDGPIEAALKAKEEGLIKHISFSYHDAPQNMAEIIDSGYFESVLMQYNLLDRSNEKNIDYAQSKGLGVVIMGPVGGGRLGAPSPAILELLGGRAKSSAEIALRYVLSNPNVNIALSGMGSIAMVEENAAAATGTGSSGPAGSLTEEERGRVRAMMEENKRLAELYCTGCKYCMPCPQGLDIPHIFQLMNYHRVYGLTEYARGEYKQIVTGTSWVKSADASKCAACGACEKKCPQKLKIINQLKETHLALA
ncbi:MAG: aldo/keto reductase [Clostridiales bacterium]|jgi:predicted aldo/keto reductase-like oxidoreductase|nr:aldo/keto reductase [Clostridiales bacterium]